MNIPELTYENIDDSPPDYGWEELCERGRMKASGVDANQWDLGDLALQVETDYGKNRLGEYAKAINKPFSTLSQYRSMSAYYQKDTRYLFENLSRSHYLAAKSLKDVSASLELLTQASNEDGWTSGRVAIECRRIRGKPVPPKKIMDYEGCILEVDDWQGRVVIQLAPGANMLNMSELINKTYRFKVYEVAA